MLDLDAHRADVELWVEPRRKCSLPTRSRPSKQTFANAIAGAPPYSITMRVPLSPFKSRLRWKLASGSSALLPTWAKMRLLLFAEAGMAIERTTTQRACAPRPLARASLHIPYKSSAEMTALVFDVGFTPQHQTFV